MLEGSLSKISTSSSRGVKGSPMAELPGQGCRTGFSGLSLPAGLILSPGNAARMRGIIPQQSNSPKVKQMDWILLCLETAWNNTRVNNY